MRTSGLDLINAPFKRTCIDYYEPLVRTKHHNYVVELTPMRPSLAITRQPPERKVMLWFNHRIQLHLEHISRQPVEREFSIARTMTSFGFQARNYGVRAHYHSITGSSSGYCAGCKICSEAAMLSFLTKSSPYIIYDDPLRALLQQIGIRTVTMVSSRVITRAQDRVLVFPPARVVVL